jgi:hypothetical protein
MHIEVSISWGFLISPLMADTGQLRLHFPHPIQLLLIFRLVRAVQTPAGQFFSTIWDIYSSRKLARVDKTGLGAV